MEADESQGRGQVRRRLGVGSAGEDSGLGKRRQKQKQWLQLPQGKMRTERQTLTVDKSNFSGCKTDGHSCTSETLKNSNMSSRFCVFLTK